MPANLSPFSRWSLGLVWAVDGAPFSESSSFVRDRSCTIRSRDQVLDAIRSPRQALSHPYLCSFLWLLGPLDALRAAGRTVFRSCCAWWPLAENVISGSNGGIKEKKKNDNTVEGQILIVLLRAFGFRRAECKNLLQALSSSAIVWAREQGWAEKIERAICHASLFEIWQSTRFAQSSSIPRLSDGV